MTLCDIGNTTFHFLDEQKDFKYSINESLGNLTISYPLYFISVNDKASIELLSQFPDAIDLRHSIKLDTNYAQTLGVDRAMACYGVNNGIVVDFGSAITVDIIKNGFHKGGYIFPGINALKELYPQISPKLHFEYNKNIHLNELPNTTDDAISDAITLMLVAPIKKLQQEQQLPLLFTGEQAKSFLDYFSDVTYEQHLIFNNMKQLIQEEYK